MLLKGTNFSSTMLKETAKYFLCNFNFLFKSNVIGLCVTLLQARLTIVTDSGFFKMFHNNKII